MATVIYVAREKNFDKQTVFIPEYPRCGKVERIAPPRRAAPHRISGPKQYDGSPERPECRPADVPLIDVITKLEHRIGEEKTTSKVRLILDYSGRSTVSPSLSSSYQLFDRRDDKDSRKGLWFKILNIIWLPSYVIMSPIKKITNAYECFLVDSLKTR